MLGCRITAGNSGNAQRKARDGSQVGGDILAHDTVAAGRAKGKDTVLIMQNNSQSVQFWFQEKIRAGNPRVHPQNAFIPGERVLAAETIREAKDGGRVADFSEFFRDLAADFLGG